MACDNGRYVNPVSTESTLFRIVPLSTASGWIVIESIFRCMSTNIGFRKSIWRIQICRRQNMQSEQPNLPKYANKLAYLDSYSAGADMTIFVHNHLLNA